MRIYRSEKSVSVPKDLNLTELLNTSARTPVLSDSHLIAKDDLEGRTLTVGQLRSNAGRLAHGLTAAFKPQDQSRWAVILPNSVAYLEACHAVLWLGGIFCPINHLLTAHELSTAFSICRPDFIIVFADVVDKVLESIAMWKGKGTGGPPLVTAIGPKDHHPYLNDFLSSQSLAIPHYADTKTRLASIHLSSGTSKSPAVQLYILG